MNEHLMSDPIKKFFDTNDRIELRGGGKPAIIHMHESERPTYKGRGYGILIINSEGLIEEIKYVDDFPDVNDIKPFMESLDKAYITALVSDRTITRMIQPGVDGWTLEEIISYLEDEYPSEL